MNDKCYRCEKEFENLFSVPYATYKISDVVICQECSTELYKQVGKFVDFFIFNKDGYAIFRKNGYAIITKEIEY